jgi:dihydrodipicolinate synthase/N-acetylneuraminate lyase
MTRQEITTELFGGTIPRLWCPAITHFKGPKSVDRGRTHNHLEVLSRNIRGLLIPGSTGEGWDMSDEEILALLDVVLDKTKETQQLLLVGILKTTTEEMVAAIEGTISWLLDRAGVSAWEDAFRKLGVRGFVVCPPGGAELTQEEISAGLSAVLDLGYPTALYQLPQVTQNEMTPATAASLAERFDNFFMLKDTSGGDKVALSGDLAGYASKGPASGSGVFLVRGAEGGYSRWPKAGGGPYDGLLLSTTNSFPEELSAVLDFLASGDTAEAEKLSRRVEEAVSTVMTEMASFTAANAFATTNKVFDHVRAWGARSIDIEPPMVYDGTRLPASAIQLGVDTLRKQKFDFDKGYLE